MKSYHQKKNAAVKMKVFTHYSEGAPRCACCGVDFLEFLTIDHMDGIPDDQRTPGRGVGRITGIQLYRWLLRNDLPKGYRVLCFNCNCAFGFWGGCPHQGVFHFDRSV